MRFGQFGQIWQRRGTAGKHQVIDVANWAARRVKELQKAANLLCRGFLEWIKYLGFVVIR